METSVWGIDFPLLQNKEGKEHRLSNHLEHEIRGNLRNNNLIAIEKLIEERIAWLGRKEIQKVQNNKRAAIIVIVLIPPLINDFICLTKLRVIGGPLCWKRPSTVEFLRRKNPFENGQRRNVLKVERFSTDIKKHKNCFSIIFVVRRTWIEDNYLPFFYRIDHQDPVISIVVIGHQNELFIIVMTDFHKLVAIN